MGREEGKQNKSEQHTAEKCDHWMTICWLEEEVGQACFLLKSHAGALSYMVMKEQSNISKMQKFEFTSKHQ